MTRKHFEAIAKTIKDTDMTDGTRDRVARELAYTLGSFNPNFNRARFLKACGVDA